MPVIDIPDLPSNSLSKRGQQALQTPTQREKMEVVSNAKVRKKKKRNTILDLFIYEDIDNIAEYMIKEVVVPTIKDIALGSMEMLFYGEVTGKRVHGRKKKEKGRSWTSYDDPEPRRIKRDEDRGRRARFDFDSIAWESRGEAEDVLDAMCDILENHDFVTVADFYDLAGIDCDTLSEEYGWEDLRRASVVKTRYNDYIISLPRPKEI